MYWSAYGCNNNLGGKRGMMISYMNSKIWPYKLLWRLRELTNKFAYHWHKEGFKYALTIGYMCMVIIDRTIQNTKMRYYRAICGAIGRNVAFDRGVRIHGAPNLYLGDNVGLNYGCWVNAGGGITIGDNTRIGPMVIIHSANHRFDRLDIPIYQQGWIKKPVVIEDDVWVAARCIILPGVRIGKGSVIAAGAVVTHDIPPYAVAMGVPAIVTGSRTEMGRGQNYEEK